MSQHGLHTTCITTCCNLIGAKSYDYQVHILRIKLISHMTMVLVLIIAFKSSACDLLTALSTCEIKKGVAKCQTHDPSLVVV